MDWLWNLLAALFGKDKKKQLDALPDYQAIPDATADEIVGSVDDTDPVELEDGDPTEVADPAADPEFDATHPGEDETDVDPDVVITDDPEDGSVYSDPNKAV